VTAVHWSSLAADPMDGAVLARRRATIAAARRDPIEDRTTYLCDLVRGRRALDVGVVDHDLRTDRSDRWLHGALAEAAAEIVGLDVVDDEVEELRRRGYDVRRLDITDGELPDGRFDVVVAGEVIEHLARPGELFGAAARLLEPDGRLVLSSPNPYAAWRVVQHLRGDLQENADHVVYVDAWGIAEFAERAGMRLESFRGIRTRTPGAKAAALRLAVRSRLVRAVPELLCESILYEVVIDA
jgi:2-polyprenyl-3-methyl-5-hydroxy-6-metoxy-1,4-benzoquinol methylase